MEVIRPTRLIGEAMLERELITNEQLDQGLRYQTKVKKLIGESLVDLGFLREDTLLDFLTGFFYKYEIPSATHDIKILHEIGDFDIPDFRKWLILMVKQNASDLHLITGVSPQLRINGELVSVKLKPLSPDTIKNLVYGILTHEEIKRFEKNKILDKSFEIGDISRYRINLHWQRDSVGVSVRALPLQIPSFEMLGVPSVLADFASKPSGLVLVTGPAGCGKSTTLAAMLEYINITRSVNIITIEDPIEYVFKSKKSLIRQREIGKDTLSFKEALKSVVRQDPNIIFLGEMRDLDTVRAALTLAETGHLVLSTLHTQDAVHSINRIVDVFPFSYQYEIRVKLSLSLQGIVVQQLLPRADRNGRVLACEILNCNHSIRNLIRENDLSQIRSFIQIGGQYSMRTMNQSLADLYAKGIISLEEARLKSNDWEEFIRLLSAFKERRRPELC